MKLSVPLSPMTRLREWFDARPAREQALLSALALVALAGLALAVWRPLADARAHALARVFRYDELLSRTAQLKEPLLLGAPGAGRASLPDSVSSHGLGMRRV